MGIADSTSTNRNNRIICLPFCRKWFLPDVRQKGRQKTCSPACQRELHRRQCEQWNRKNKAVAANNYLAKKLEEGETLRTWPSFFFHEWTNVKWFSFFRLWFISFAGNLDYYRVGWYPMDCSRDVDLLILSGGIRRRREIVTCQLHSNSNMTIGIFCWYSRSEMQ